MTDWNSLRKAADEATSGPWGHHGRDSDHDLFLSQGREPSESVGLGCEVVGPERPALRGDFSHPDVAYIVAACNAVPEMLALLAEARVRLVAGHGDSWKECACEDAALIAKLPEPVEDES